MDPDALIGYLYLAWIIFATIGLLITLSRRINND